MHEVGIHADLHNNNVTAFAAALPKEDNLCKVYVAGPEGQADTYVLPYCGTVGCVIDYSRVLINPQQRTSLEQSQGVEPTNAFFRTQATRVLMAVDRWLPAFAKKHQEKLKGAAFAMEQDLYNVLTALDYLAIGHNLGTLLESIGEDSRAWNPSPRSAALCTKLAEVARAELLAGLQVVALRAGGKNKEAPASPFEVGRRIMAAVFEDFLYSNWDPADLSKLMVVNVVNSQTPLRYSGSSVDRFPPWLQPENLVKFSGGKSIKEILSRGDRPLLDILEMRGEHPEGIDNTLELAIEGERSKLVDRPPESVETSWLV